MKILVNPQIDIYIVSLAGTSLHLGPSATKHSVELSPKIWGLLIKNKN